MASLSMLQDVSIEQAHQERLQRCAELGQVVPIDKPRIRVVYEQLAGQQLAEHTG